MKSSQTNAGSQFCDFPFWRWPHRCCFCCQLDFESFYDSAEDIKRKHRKHAISVTTKRTSLFAKEETYKFRKQLRFVIAPMLAALHDGEAIALCAPCKAGSWQKIHYMMAPTKNVSGTHSGAMAIANELRMMLWLQPTWPNSLIINLHSRRSKKSLAVKILRGSVACFLCFRFMSSAES